MSMIGGVIMGRKWIRKTVGKVAKTHESGKEPQVSNDEGYELLMDIIDRKVFSVEDSRVSSGEFERLSQWMVNEYQKATTTRVGGRVIKVDPMMMVEVIGDEPVFVEIHDYKARYRVNVYPETMEVDIQVLEPVKDKVLAYNKTPKAVLTL